MSEEDHDDDSSIDAAELAMPPLRMGVTTSAIRPLVSPLMTGRRTAAFSQKDSASIFDDQAVIRGYASVPLMELDLLPRGGLSFETNAVGRIQFGIPPETIKDSMQMGIEVPRVYIVPVERFCREQGPSLGVNLAEFEFPAYFNYFVRNKRCKLVVESPAAETSIRSVFGETLLGPAHFRDHEHPLSNVDDDFDASFPKDRRPNFYKELANFRAAEKTAEFDELEIDTLVDFVHYNSCRRDNPHQKEKLGVPPQASFMVDGMDPTTASPLISPFRSPASRSPASNTSSGLSSGNEKGRPRIPNLSDSRTSLPSTSIISSQSSAIEHSEPAAVPRRSSLVSEYSQMSQTTSLGSSQHSILYSSGGKLQRRNSDGSRSKSSHASDSKTSRRSSIGSHEDKPAALRSINRRVSWTTSQSSLMNTSVSTLDQPKPPSFKSNKRRDSLFTNYSSRASTKVSGTSSIDSYDFIMDEEPDRHDTNWMYSQAKWLGDVATIFPADATAEQRFSKSCARVEIFKMAGGTEYIVHDIDENNIIVGKTRFSGTVHTPDELEVQGFLSNEQIKETDYMDYEEEEPKKLSSPVQSTFHPPSFGVTVLGNSHGFDKNGSTSGYVLWVNGRGIMVDPPPYSNTTLEREGIRPQMIMGIIITHCHADHDAGAFQKVMRGSRVAIITTPTIYDSFIRKYSALSGLKASLLRHSHRHRPAIIGQPLRFQGAVFHFTYTLHTIPCISFKVEWRGRSIVFTGDHMNIPKEIDRLENEGILSKGRADDLRRLPVQKCDVLLHEAGAPPIHTPLAELQKLPMHVKDRLYVVHTAAIPPDCGLKVAPTGTAGTIRLDSTYTPSHSMLSTLSKISPPVNITAANLQDGKSQNITMVGKHDPSSTTRLINQFNGRSGRAKVAPLVFLRPTDVSDAWFILNLLSAVPFLSSLSYGHTMEFLEIAHVELYCKGETVIEGGRRSEVLCVFWEGACSEEGADTVWYAGDWTGPAVLQPDLHHAAAGSNQELEDIVAISEEGVKVITLPMKEVMKILKNGSKLFRKYLALQNQQQLDLDFHRGMPASSVPKDHSVLALIQANSVLRNLNANQRITLESLAEGPRYFPINGSLWQHGDPVEYALIIVEGTATMGKVEKRRSMSFSRRNRRGSTGGMSKMTAINEQSQDLQIKPIVDVAPDKVLHNVNRNSEYYRLLECLNLRAEEQEELDEDGDARSQTDKATDAVQEQRDKFSNKVLARLYARQAYTENLVFSRGCFLSDTSRMISGDLANIHKTGGGRSGSMSSNTSFNDHHSHTSSMIAGKDGCVAMVFPKASLLQFLDANPGMLLSLLGTKVLV